MKNFFVESFNKTSTIYDLKKYISEKKSLHISEIILTYQNKNINDNEIFNNIIPTHKNEYDFYLFTK
jgi:hypothetical protein